MQTEIINSPCFDRLRQERPDFDEWVGRKVVAVHGDIAKERMDMSPADEEMLLEHVNIWINVAATVDFHAPLDVALRTNTIGALQQLAMAKRCRNLIAFCQTSTAYVNSNLKNGWVEEQLYPLMFEPEETLERCLAMPQDELERITPTLVGEYPNTYTLTKSMAEHLLRARRGDVPLAIVRPSCVGSSLAEPVPGWVDAVNATGAIYLQAGVGILGIQPGSGDLIGDQIPADFVCNLILAAVAKVAEKRSFEVFMSGSSAINPATWGFCGRTIVEYWRENTPQAAIQKPEYRLIPNATHYKLAFFWRHTLPTKAYNTVAKLTGNKEMIETGKKLTKLADRVHFFSHSFWHFANNEWIFSSRNAENLFASLSPEEQETFNFNAAEIDWHHYLFTFCYGLQRYILKEAVEPPAPRSRDLRSRGLIASSSTNRVASFFSDIAWAYEPSMTGEMAANSKLSRLIRAKVLASDRVQQTIRDLCASNPSVSHAAQEARAKEILGQMGAEVRRPVIRLLAFVMRKIWRQIYNDINVEESGLVKLRKVLADGGQVVFLPTHRSYIDFLIVSYVLFAYNLPIPHIAAGEDFLNMAIVNWLFRSSGAFFMRRKLNGDDLYKSIFVEYIHELLGQGQHVEFFLEGTRSRTGKTLPPKYGIMGIVVDAFMEKKPAKDLHCVSVGLAYERTLELDSYVRQMLGESKTKESLSALFGAANVLADNFGRIDVAFGEPIRLADVVAEETAAVERSVSGQPNGVQQTAEAVAASAAVVATKPVTIPAGAGAADVAPLAHRSVVTKLAERVVRDFSHRVTYTSAVAALILCFRQGISRELLVTKLGWLVDEIEARGGIMSCAGTGGKLTSVSKRLDRAIEMLDPLVQFNRNTMVEPSKEGVGSSRTRDTGLKSSPLMGLSYYRNGVMALFFTDAVAFCAFSSCVTETRVDASARRADIVAACVWLSDVLFNEIAGVSELDYSRFTLETAYETVVDRLLSQGHLRAVAGSPEGPNQILALAIDPSSDLFSLATSVVRPFIDSYWTCALTISSVANQTVMLMEQALLERVQWLAETLVRNGMLPYAESSSLEPLRNALKTFEKRQDVVRLSDTRIRVRRNFNDDVLRRLSTYRGTAADDHAEAARLLQTMPDFAGLAKL